MFSKSILTFTHLQVNYFISHATTAVFVKAAGAPSAYSAIIIGVPNVSAGIVAILHCWHASRESSTASWCRFRTRAIRRFMIIGALMGAIGNAVHAYAIDRGSVELSIAGRFLLGFSAAEILQREILHSCIPSRIVTESALLLMSRVAGVSAGFFVGAASAVPFALQRMGVGGAYSPHARQLQFASWMMMLLWLVHLLRVLVQIRAVDQPIRQRSSSIGPDEQVSGAQIEAPAAGNYDSDSSSSSRMGIPSCVVHRSSSELTTHVDPIESAFGTGEWGSENDNHPDEPAVHQRDEGWGSSQRRPGTRQWKTLGRIRKLLAFHIGIPISLFVVLYTSYAIEVFFTATPLITYRYFAWSGARAGAFLGILAIFVLPIMFICEVAARRYEERSILKVSAAVIGSDLHDRTTNTSLSICLFL